MTDGAISLSADAFAARAATLAAFLQAARPRIRVLGLFADNGQDWLAVDRAASAAHIVLVPLPPFFTPDQAAHALAASGADALVTIDPAGARSLGFADTASLPESPLVLARRVVLDPPPLPPGTSKVTFTSGTTGAPKGVCLDDALQWRVAESIALALHDVPIERHLCVLPLSILLENVAGAYAPMIRGATVCVPPVRRGGLVGASGFDPLACLQALSAFDANSVILLPQMLFALTLAVEHGASVPPSLRFAAVGGAKVAPSLIARARAAGLPAYEGYGLSECASVVALNVPRGDRPGTVGRPLAHVRLVPGPEGEVLVDGPVYLGYTGDAVVHATGAPFSTGDLGRVDDEGFLHIDGRCKDTLITSYGRNVSPAWPEAELVADGVIAQAVVVGDARPVLAALLAPRDPAVSEARLAASVVSTNRRLPDYARIGAWLRADDFFTTANGLGTANGRPRRDAVLARYAARIDALYESTLPHALP